MELVARDDAETAAREAVVRITQAATMAIRARGHFHLALSGGETPRRLLALLADAAIDWARVSLWQVDERIVPAGDPARNLVGLQALLLERLSVRPSFTPIPVNAVDLTTALIAYGAQLPAALDLVHLGLGTDGHTASLVPGDAVLDATGPLAVTGVYAGHRRVTLTRESLHRARQLLYLVTGAAKAPALRRFLNGDTTIPAGRVHMHHAVVIADRTALAGGN